MPFVEIYTRERIPDDARERLAEAITTTMTVAEVGQVTDASRAISMVWCQTLGESDHWRSPGWTAQARPHSVLARVVAPEAFVTQEQRERAIREVTADLRAASTSRRRTTAGPSMSCSRKIPDGPWGVAGKAVRLQAVMPGHVSAERKAGIKDYFEGQARLRKDYGIPV